MGELSMLEILNEAKANKYAVGYFESWNLESTRAVISAANEERSPVIIGVNGTILEEHGSTLEYYANILRVGAKEAQVPVTLLLNEASSFGQIVKGIRFGFSSVMFDGSSMPFDENVKLTRKVVEVAHSVGVSVEGQMDELPQSEEGNLSKRISKSSLTDPKRACDFVKQTGIDALSVSVGNVHILYKQQTDLDLDCVRAVAETVPVPLVVHGATGITDDSIKKAIALGICKINIGTVLRSTFTTGMKIAIEEKPSLSVEDVLGSGELRLKSLVKKKMLVYGSSGRAKSYSSSS